MFSSMFFEEEICIYEALLNVYKKKYWTIGTVQMYINKHQFCKKHSGKTLHTHHRAQHNMHLNCFVYSKLCQSNLALLIYKFMQR